MWEGKHRRALCVDARDLIRQPRLRRASRLFLAASVGCLKFTGGALGANDTWTSGSGFWTGSDNADWSLGSPPAAGDNAELTDNDGISRTITYDYYDPSVTLSTVTVANLGSGTNELSLPYSDFTLSAQTENVASVDDHDTSNGEILQSAGYNNVSGSLNLGIYEGDSGLYSLQGGTLSVTASGGSEVVGFGGTFNQTGGLNTLPMGGGAFVQVNGIYSLSSTGQLSVLGYDLIGDQGIGTFVQSGGTNQISFSISKPNGGFFLGYGTSDVGSYTLSAGNLNVTGTDETIGSDGRGSFFQTGGTNSITAGQLGLGGDYGSSGYYSLSASGNLNVSGYPEIIGLYGSGTFVQSGGTNSISGTDLEIASAYTGTGSYSLRDCFKTM